MNKDQLSLLLPATETQQPAQDVDEWSRRVAAGAPDDPHLTERNRMLSSADLPIERASLERPNTVQEPTEPSDAESHQVDQIALPHPFDIIRRTLAAGRPVGYVERPKSMLDRTIERRRKNLYGKDE